MSISSGIASSQSTKGIGQSCPCWVPCQRARASKPTPPKALGLGPGSRLVTAVRIQSLSPPHQCGSTAAAMNPQSFPGAGVVSPVKLLPAFLSRGCRSQALRPSRERYISSPAHPGQAGSCRQSGTSPPSQRFFSRIWCMLACWIFLPAVSAWRQKGKLFSG